MVPTIKERVNATEIGNAITRTSPEISLLLESDGPKLVVGGVVPVDDVF
jgi:hypothetical protein